MSLLTFSKKMELALEFWSLPFRFLMNASANLLVFVAKCLGVSWDPLGLAWVSLGPFWDSLGTHWDQIHGSQGVPRESQKGPTETQASPKRSQETPRHFARKTTKLAQAFDKF